MILKEDENTSVRFCYLLIGVAVVNIERVHGLHDGHDGLQGVAVNDGNKLQALFKWVTIFVNNSGEKMLQTLRL